MATPTRADLTPEQRITLGELRIKVTAAREAKVGYDEARHERDEMICMLREQGLSLRQIGNPAGLTPSDVLHILKARGMS